MTATGTLYPLRFQSILDECGWGGDLLGEFRAADGSPRTAARAGISWEIVDAPERASVVAEGPLAGQTLTDLVAEFPRELVGRRHRKGEPFPVCLRFLDVGRALPLMVHPDERISREIDHLQPNTKFWYCLAARAQGEIMVGIRRRVIGMQILDNLNSTTLKDLLQLFPAAPGDAYLIPAGRVFAAAAGTLIWELGQRPVEGLTVSGWSAATATQLSADSLELRAVHFEDRQVARISRESGVSPRTRKLTLVPHCPYFIIDEIRLVDHLFDKTDGTSFHLLSVTSGCVELGTDTTETLRLQAGESCLIPALFGGYRCVAVEGLASLLRVKLPGLR